MIRYTPLLWPYAMTSRKVRIELLDSTYLALTSFLAP